MQVLRSCTRSADTKCAHITSHSVLIKSRLARKCRRRHSHLFVAENDRVITDPIKSSKILEPILPQQNAAPTPIELPGVEASTEHSTTAEQVSATPSTPESQTPPKKVPLTARERLRAARVLSRYSEAKPAKSEMGRSVLDALRESEKGKKGLPEAPTNLFDDSKRGLPKQGLTFDFPGGSDLFLIVFSFVFISTVMFATTYIVWKVGAIHFNEY